MRTFRECNIDVEQNTQDKGVVRSKVASYFKLRRIIP